MKLLNKINNQIIKILLFIALVMFFNAKAYTNDLNNDLDLQAKEQTEIQNFIEKCSKQLSVTNSPYTHSECKINNLELIINLTPKDAYIDNIKKISRKDIGQSMCNYFVQLTYIEKVTLDFYDEKNILINQIVATKSECIN